MRPLLVAVLCVSLVGCSSLGFHAQPNFIDRVLTGDVPDNPEQAEEWLEGITQQVRALAVPIRVGCKAAYIESGIWPTPCREAQAWQDRLGLARSIFGEGIQVWRAAGGNDNKAATEAFRRLLEKHKPEATLYLDLLSAWRGDYLAEAPIVPEEITGEPVG